MSDQPTRIIGIRFNECGPAIPDAQIQSTWAKAVTERRKERTQEQDADGLAERLWSQR